MPQQINRKILFYLFLFTILGTLNNKDLKEFDLPKINLIKVNGLEFNHEFETKLEFLKLNNIFLLNKIKIEELFDNNNLIEEYKIFKKYPSSLEVEIIKTRFLALTNINGNNFFVGSNGKLIKSENSIRELPFIFGDFEIDNFLYLKKIIDESDLDFKEIKNLYSFPTGRWDIETSSEILIKLPFDRLKESLELSLELLKNEKFTKVKLIDVRQKSQVVIND